MAELFSFHKSEKFFPNFFSIVCYWFESKKWILLFYNSPTHAQLSLKRWRSVDSRQKLLLKKKNGNATDFDKPFFKRISLVIFHMKHLEKKGKHRIDRAFFLKSKTRVEFFIHEMEICKNKTPRNKETNLESLVWAVYEWESIIVDEIHQIQMPCQFIKFKLENINQSFYKTILDVLWEKYFSCFIFNVSNSNSRPKVFTSYHYTITEFEIIYTRGHVQNKLYPVFPSSWIYV